MKNNENINDSEVSTKQDDSPALTDTSKKSGSLVSKGISLSILTLGSRILGLVREMTKARFLGTTSYSDAFNVAFMVPNLFRRLFAENSVSVAFIPTFKNYLEDSSTEEGKKDTQAFINATFTLLSFLVVLFVSLGMIFTPLIMKIFFKTENLESFNESIVLTRIMFPYLAIISVAALFQGILNGLKIFSPSGFTPILFNGLVILLTYLLAPYTANPARAMAIGVIVGGSVQALFQLPFVIKHGWKIGFTGLKKAFTNPGTIKVLKLIGPTIIGMAAYQLNDIVSTALATRAGTGIASSLQYSLRLQELVLGIFAVSIGTVILPDLTGFANKSLWEEFNAMLSQAIKIMTLISIPVTFYCLVMGENLITLIFKTGKFDENSIRQTTEVFAFHISGLVFIAINRIISPAFYAQSDTKSPTIAGIIGFLVNMVLALCLVKPLGGMGIALALTVASAVNTVVLFIFMKNVKNIQVGRVVKESILYALKMIVLSIIASVPIIFLKKPLVDFFAGHSRIYSQGIPVTITAIIFATVGVISLFVTKDPLVKTVIRKIKK